MPYIYGTETSNFILTCLRAGKFPLKPKNRESFAMMPCAHHLISLTSNYIYLFWIHVVVSYLKCVIFCILPVVRYEYIWIYFVARKVTNVPYNVRFLRGFVRTIHLIATNGIYTILRYESKETCQNKLCRSGYSLVILRSTRMIWKVRYVGEAITACGELSKTTWDRDSNGIGFV